MKIPNHFNEWILGTLLYGGIRNTNWWSHTDKYWSAWCLQMPWFQIGINVFNANVMLTSLMSYLHHYVTLLTHALRQDNWSLNISYNRDIIKSPHYTGWLYVFVPVHTLSPPRAAESCSCDNFWTTFQISFIFSTIVGPDLKFTWSDFGLFSLWPWR